MGTLILALLLALSVGAQEGAKSGPALSMRPGEGHVLPPTLLLPGSYPALRTSPYAATLLTTEYKGAGLAWRGAGYLDVRSQKDVQDPKTTTAGPSQTVPMQPVHNALPWFGATPNQEHDRAPLYQARDWFDGAVLRPAQYVQVGAAGGFSGSETPFLRALAAEFDVWRRTRRTSLSRVIGAADGDLDPLKDLDSQDGKKTCFHHALAACSTVLGRPLSIDRIKEVVTPVTRRWLSRRLSQDEAKWKKLVRRGRTEEAHELEKEMAWIRDDLRGLATNPDDVGQTRHTMVASIRKLGFRMVDLESDAQAEKHISRAFVGQGNSFLFWSRRLRASIRRTLSGGRVVLANVYTGDFEGHVVVVLRQGIDERRREVAQIFEPFAGTVFTVLWRRFHPFSAFSVTLGRSRP